MPWLVGAVVAAVSSLAQTVGAPVDLPKGLPPGLWGGLIPPSNPVTVEKIDLGRRLYYDKRLSVDGTIACSTCHDPEKGFADGRKVAEGIGGKPGTRNSPTVLNAVFNELQFWDGRAGSLEEQAKGPLINPIEMGMKDHDAVVAVVQKDAAYAADFPKVFGRAANIDDIVAAIATFERTVVSGDSAFDRFNAGDATALSPAAQARIRPVERKSALRHLPLDRPAESELHGQQVPQHRRGQGPEPQSAIVQGGSTGDHQYVSFRCGGFGTGPVRGRPTVDIHRSLQDAWVTGRGAHRPLHA